MLQLHILNLCFLRLARPIFLASNNSSQMLSLPTSTPNMLISRLVLNHHDYAEPLHPSIPTQNKIVLFAQSSHVGRTTAFI